MSRRKLMSTSQMHEEQGNYIMPNDNRANRARRQLREKSPPRPDLMKLTQAELIERIESLEGQVCEYRRNRRAMLLRYNEMCEYVSLHPPSAAWRRVA
jgi:hypothetical protein